MSIDETKKENHLWFSNGYDNLILDFVNTLGILAELYEFYQLELWLLGYFKIYFPIIFIRLWVSIK